MYDKREEEVQSKGNADAEIGATPLNFSGPEEASAHTDKGIAGSDKTTNGIPRPVVAIYGPQSVTEHDPVYQDAFWFGVMMADWGWAGRTAGGLGVDEAFRRGIQHADGVSYEVGGGRQRENRNETLQNGVRAIVVIEGGRSGPKLDDFLPVIKTGKVPVVFVSGVFRSSAERPLRQMVATGDLNKRIFGTVKFAHFLEEAASCVLKVDAKLMAERRRAAEGSPEVVPHHDMGAHARNVRTVKTTDVLSGPPETNPHRTSSTGRISRLSEGAPTTERGREGPEKAL
ncbi:hypothetical protein [Yinghuangia sp. YIM S10712]|uniref:hypothetical protein n=1 Tax=Yinghuangia sp. YIM S10712 TaxID=3436930 RepID=UPI003F53D312